MKVLLTSLIIFGTFIIAQSQCNASFTWDGTDITIQFIDLSTSDVGDPIVSWLWDFDDNGNTSSEQNPIYTFSDPDDYNVMLTITTQSGCMSTITIEIETCVLDVNYIIGDCDINGNIPVDITVNDPWDVAEEVDIILNGQSVIGSPFAISAGNPINITVDVPGNGLDQILQFQSTEIGTCGEVLEFPVPDCNSDCFLSGIQVNLPIGTTHFVEVGDDFFAPVSTGVIIGDIIEFNWIGDGHSTTSDATTGVDAWNSGVISQGSTFDLSITNPGTHPYYCIPHGGPGGVGMSGEILSNCPTGNSLDIILSFNSSIADPAGFNVYYDGNIISGSPFSYNGIGTQELTLNIAGDGNLHSILIEDIADPNCTLSLDYESPDCNQGGGDPVCSITIDLGMPSGCDPNQNVTIDATITVANGGSGFNLSIDGNTSTFYDYTGPNTTINLTLPGDGMNHSIEVVDDLDPVCIASTNIVTPDCNLPCSITNLTAIAGGSGGSGIIHSVNVEDFIFNPSVINITEGDQVEWVWTGNVAHTSTSDVTTGLDSWDSGLLNNGDTYLSPILTEGEHPYYCIPHGNPGGSGMAGTIFVLPPCNINDEVMVTVSFDITSNGTNGYEILVDGVIAGSFTYLAGSGQSATINVPGDGNSHIIEVRDVDDVSCSATANITTADCNGGGSPICSVDLNAVIGGVCDANNQVPIDLTINAVDQGSTFLVTVDGINIGNFNYTGSITNITINIDGDGLDHTINITDDVDPSCTASTIINTPDCNVPCSISNLTLTAAGGGGSGTIHTVEVEDFIFNPSVINITEGDQVEWTWTGNVAHTSTSDINSGIDSWDSGLLSTGDTYISPILSEGEHPYYCIPHGNPGGSGMAGTIFVLPPCDIDDNVMVNVGFDVVGGGANGFEVLVDGLVMGSFSYIGGTAQTAIINVPGDGNSHVIQVIDLADSNCNASANIVTSDCNGGGTAFCVIDLVAEIGGACDVNNQVPIDLQINAADQGISFDVTVDGNSLGSFDYTGSITNITINVDGDGSNHTIIVSDNTDPSCTATTIINVPNCNAPCSITNVEAIGASGGGSGTIHSVEVEDFIFNPSIVNITAGDQVEWVWTGNVAHTSTSDISSGVDSWDSGLLSTGDTFLSPVLSEGEHPYYCIPHGNPGGSGMAGTVFVLPPCDADDNVIVNVTFDVEGPGSSGYEVLVDGVSVGTFVYTAGVSQSNTISVPGDGNLHDILVRDIEDLNCSGATNITTADCNSGGTPICEIEVMGELGGICDENNQVPLDLTINASDQGSSFEVVLDGNSLGSFDYTGSITNLTINVDGDGQSHLISVTDDIDGGCTSSVSITVPNCSASCDITNLTAIPTNDGIGNIHSVEVEDFIFNPSVINIITGDQVEFLWTGNVAHTATSDLNSGPSSFNSGLLNNGDVYLTPVLTEGEHPYYCIPHGAPGGVGMSGNIYVLPPCNGNNEVLVNVNFDIQGAGTNGFEVEIDGIVIGIFDYVAGIQQSAIINVPGDGNSHIIQVRDVLNSACSETVTIATTDCNGGGLANCQLAMNASVSGPCNEGNFVPVNVLVSAIDQGENFTLILDGVSQGVYDYTGSTTNVSLNVIGDGMDHTISIIDGSDSSCSDSVTFSTPNCNADCSIYDLNLSFNSNVTHHVLVEDFKFSPDSINVLIGDTILFDWTGNIPHTVTSDIQSGPQVFESGLLSHGATFEIVTSSLGNHSYYCIPHGAPGGIGMSGNINVQALCDGSDAVGSLSFSYQGTSDQGFNIFSDGILLSESPFSYNPSGVSSGTIIVNGDNEMHLLTVSEVGESGCSSSINYVAPDCTNNECLTVINNVNFSTCSDANISMNIEFSSLVENESHSILLNGTKINDVPILTDINSLGSFSYNLTGNGNQVELIVANNIFPSCADTIMVTLPDCDIPCLISDFEAIAGNGIHIVEVRDFDFSPKDIEINLGDTIRFLWTGVIPHTTTSDIAIGENSWDSGLFGEGHVFDLVIQNTGYYPYYCIPHGGPGGIGMAGSINVVEPCVQGEFMLNYQFSISAGSHLGYNLFLDGELINNNPIDYLNPTGFNNGTINLPGDGMDHLLTIQDLETEYCAFTTMITTEVCELECKITNLEVQLGPSIVNLIEVRDFDFFPELIEVNAGETIRFINTGQIPHTSTSDLLDGPDSWDSGLLSSGDVYDLNIHSAGTHPYYCIPHGGPGAIGQSGVISVFPACLNGNQEVSISFDIQAGSADGFKLFLDGELQGGLRPYDNRNGNNKVAIDFPADGEQHIVTIQDSENPVCAASAFYNSINCNDGCELSGLNYKLSNVKHVVEVRDFDFLPLELNIELGDTILFDWKGDIAHTVTSDAISGESIFNSGLLEKGDTWELVLQELGSHPYYCIPHGGPGGVGMAAIINVVDPCSDESVNATFKFSSNQLVGTYQVLLNGSVVLAGMSYSTSSQNEFQIELPADGTDIEILVVDELDQTCSISKSIDGINCSDPCFSTSAAFSFDINFATLEAQFEDQSVGNIVAWNWDFGDGSSSDLQNPNHVFSEPIVYEVCLEIRDENDCVELFCDKVRFSEEVCEANFEYIQNDLNFTFINTSDYEDPNTDFLWTFGDGQISTDIDSVFHIYEIGIYDICLQISSDSCESNICLELDLTDPCLTISPAFEATKLADELSVQFSDQTLGAPDSWLWGFGDGNTSTEQNPVHIYNEAGIYNVCLFVQDDNLSCSKSICKLIDLMTTGLEELEVLNTLSIYPNPSNVYHEIFIEGIHFEDLNKSAILEIYNMHGKLLVKDELFLTNNLTLSFESDPGTYYIKISAENSSYGGLVIRI